MATAIIRFIDRLNETVGRAVSWLAVLVVVTACVVAVLRYGFSLGWVGLQESYVWMHGVLFMVASGYTLRHDGHVRIDLIYGSLGPRGKAYVNLFGVLVLLFPMLFIVGWVVYPYVALSWERLETSREAGGLPGLFLLKSSMLVFVILLALQGLALALRSVLVLRGAPNWDPSNPPDDAVV